MLDVGLASALLRWVLGELFLKTLDLCANAVQTTGDLCLFARMQLLSLYKSLIREVLQLAVRLSVLVRICHNIVSILRRVVRAHIIILDIVLSVEVDILPLASEDLSILGIVARLNFHHVLLLNEIAGRRV